MMSKNKKKQLKREMDEADREEKELRDRILAKKAEEAHEQRRVRQEFDKEEREEQRKLKNELKQQTDKVQREINGGKPDQAAK